MAIHEAGQLCREVVGESKVAFVNGILQTIKREILIGGKTPDSAATDSAKTDSAPEPDPREERLRPLFKNLEKKPADWIAAWYSHPRWLVRRWSRQLGRETAEAICRFNNRPVDLAFHVTEPQDPGEACELLMEAGCPVRQANIQGALIAENRPGRQLLNTVLERFKFLTVQDLIVQEATGWLATLADDDPIISLGNSLGNLPLLDMCAAPGGKTAFLAARWPGQGRIVALDNRKTRLSLLAGTIKRIGTERVDIVLGDGKIPPFAPATFSAVLLDGPCSGTGVIRRHPDGRWQLQREAPEKNSRTLLKLAEKAADLLAPGGLLMYATCSLEPEENQNVVDELLSKRDDLLPAPDANGQWQKVWVPQEHGGDGFFAARLRKNVESNPAGDA